MLYFFPIIWCLKFYMHGGVAQNLPLYFLERITPHADLQGCYLLS
uniref:Uncharacterized protein n=1 Tax=Arundo donax TaxID=35708 RepID=A0A0A8YKU2_ARUDO